MLKPVLELLYKRELSVKVFYLVYASDQEVAFEPGQFLNLEVGTKIFRPLSIVYSGSELPPQFQDEIDSELLVGKKYFVTILMNCKPGGPASIYFETVIQGEKIQAIGPAGRFRLVENDRPKIFVATSTGLAPFVPMIEQLLIHAPLSEVKLFFGSWEKSGSFADLFLGKFLDKDLFPNFELVRVVDQLTESEPGFESGRVTSIIPARVNLEENRYDFYLCGNPAMVTDTTKVLKDLGIKNIYTENYGSLT